VRVLGPRPRGVAGNKVLYARLSDSRRARCGMERVEDLRRPVAYRTCYDSALTGQRQDWQPRVAGAAQDRRRAHPGLSDQDSHRPGRSFTMDATRPVASCIEAIAAPRQTWRHSTMRATGKTILKPSMRKAVSTLRGTGPETVRSKCHGEPAQTQVARGFGLVVVGPAVQSLREYRAARTQVS